MTQSSKIRLDKWLWAARFYKTRSLATDVIQGGKVHYNGQRCKPSRIVEIGATISLWQANEQREVIVKALSEKRANATIAQTLYEETEQSIAKRQLHQEQRKLSPKPLAPQRRPDKKQRRQIIQFKHQHTGE
ncbi:ribosome-associated heat shock protein Hsp15 [Celerinatantimonas diazotrophica]|uniref:Heat shock protein 15 n=1 Tax=Celerinatantimonas diazotrophica TaxID=412034 RepID=A0A4R1KDR0_9GAMM|nr:ribosome-associated heat shock protein Hsp15 [Celerinatantimonas diazotrophica]TCK62756.1 heat shock protein Hsp15 [Celerinatantimonas diazotrophica]CAG9298386.1 Heat shock protein 15 [Celerinatantimonas diazotrophica]